MNKKYIFSTEAKAEEMILSLVTASEETISFRDVKRTESTNGIVVIGFQDEIEIDEESGEFIIIEEGTTFNVDVSWKIVNEGWSDYEVFPENPNHSFL
mgnify:CR=1 FL=1